VKCHRTKSHNAKGTYFYFLCSRRTRYDDCPFERRIRKDVLMAQVQQRFPRLPQLEGRIIARALELATAAVSRNRAQGDAVQAKLAEAEVRQGRLVELLMDRAIPEAAKASTGRELACPPGATAARVAGPRQHAP
jgi:hypothetical protein